jgi:hypothetical protein
LARGGVLMGSSCLLCLERMSARSPASNSAYVPLTLGIYLQQCTIANYLEAGEGCAPCSARRARTTVRR